MKSLFLIITLAFTSTVLGDQCFPSVVRSNNSYAQKVQKVQKVQQNVVYNDYKDAQVNVRHNQKYNSQFNKDYNVIQKVVEFDPEYFLGTDGYFDVVDEIQQQRGYYDRDNEIVLKQVEQVDKLILLLEKVINRLDGEKPKEYPELEPVEPQEPDYPVLEDKQVNNDDLNLKVFNIFKKSCMDCHAAPNGEAGLSLVEIEEGNEYLLDLDLKSRLLVYDSVSGKTGKLKQMPLGGPKLPQEDIDILGKWALSKLEE